MRILVELHGGKSNCTADYNMVGIDTDEMKIYDFDFLKVRSINKTEIFNTEPDNIIPLKKEWSLSNGTDTITYKDINEENLRHIKSVMLKADNIKDKQYMNIYIINGNSVELVYDERALNNLDTKYRLLVEYIKYLVTYSLD